MHFHVFLVCIALIFSPTSTKAQSNLCDKPETAIIAKRVEQIFVRKCGAPDPEDKRRFSYITYDLNRDHKMEYFVVLLDVGGTGGRRGFLLSYRLDVISEFSLLKFPIYVSTHIYHGGWPDLYINHWGKLNVGHYADGYRFNPSMWCAGDTAVNYHWRVLWKDPWDDYCTF